MAYTSIDDPSLYFQTKLYTGNATDDTAITLDGDENMSPNFVWLKDRTNANHHRLYDSVRGATKVIYSSLSNAEGTASTGLKSFDSDGFTVGTGSDENGNGANFVSWNWKEDATAGFDIVSYTGNSSDGTTTQDISHSLSAVPHWIIVKNRADSTNWPVYHKGNTSAPETEVIYLNSTNATSDDSAFFGDTAPTSSQFRVGGDNGANGNSDSMIAYVWSEKKGYSKFGSYKGNGDANGTFVYTGFKPAWLMIKSATEGSRNWVIYDNKRETFNEQEYFMRAQTNGAETRDDGYSEIDLLSNGFKLRGASGDTNKSGETFIYMAFAEAPFVNSKGVPTNAR